jgi:hypothetical protein
MTQEQGSNMRASRHEPECIYKPENIDEKKKIRWGGSPCICQELESAYTRGYLSALLEARDCLGDPDPAASIADLLADLAHP